jgi:hypothetical protein
MTCRIDHAARALTADNGADGLHLAYNVDLTYGSAMAGNTVRGCYVVHNACGRKVYDYITPFTAVENCFCSQSYRAFFANRHAVFIKQDESVSIWIYGHTERSIVLTYSFSKLRQVLGKGLGCMGEYTGSIAEEPNNLVAHSLKQHRCAYRGRAVNGIYHYALCIRAWGRAHSRDVADAVYMKHVGIVPKHNMPMLLVCR